MIKKTAPASDNSPIIEQHVQRVLTPFERFLEAQWTSGLLLFSATLLALILANSQYSELYQNLKHAPITLGVASYIGQFSIELLVNDGLMVLFFFLLGLEIKRESMAGMLQDPKLLRLSVAIALGGMLVPALLYISFSTTAEASRGWGTVMATDTAFALTILVMLGKRVPSAVPALMTALAIIDDIGAVLVIGLFYSEQIHLASLGSAALALTVLFVLNICGIRKPLPYLCSGLVLWWFIHSSGVHATTAGILAALAIPARSHRESENITQRIKKLLGRLERRAKNKHILEDQAQHEIIEEVQVLAYKTTTPLQLWGSTFERPVGLIIIPLFALFNAGIHIPDIAETLAKSEIVWPIAASLVIGKCLGISGAFWLAVKCGVSAIPKDLHWRHIIGMSLIAGIGFTMSLFIANQAYPSTLLNEAKLGIMLGSALAGTLGISCFLYSRPKNKSI